MLTPVVPVAAAPSGAGAELVARVEGLRRRVPVRHARGAARRVDTGADARPRGDPGPGARRGSAHRHARVEPRRPRSARGRVPAQRGVVVARARCSDRFDLVAFDPRGVGESEPIECVDSLDPLFDQSFQPATDEERGALVAAVTSLAQQCAARNGDAARARVDRRRGARPRTTARRAGGAAPVVRRVLVRHVPRCELRARRIPTGCARSCSTGPSIRRCPRAAVTLGQARGFEHALDDFLADCSDHRALRVPPRGRRRGRVRRVARRRPPRHRSPPAIPTAARSTRPASTRRCSSSSTSAAPRGPASPTRSPTPRRATRRRCSRAPTRSSVAPTTVATTTCSSRSGR